MKSAPKSSELPKSIREALAALEKDGKAAVQVGTQTVRAYFRKTPPGYQVADYSTGKRHWLSFPTAQEAVEGARALATRLNKHEPNAARITEAQATDYFGARKALPGVNEITDVAKVVADCLPYVGGDLYALRDAVKYYAARNKTITRKRVGDVVAELIGVKRARNASPRYLQDLAYRLEKFGTDCQRNACDVTTSDVQSWLDELRGSDGKPLASQSYRNFRTVLHSLFQFAVARSYASFNPVEGVEKVKVRSGAIEIYTPSEIARLLAASTFDVLPCIAVGAFAGLRTAEIERLDWADINLKQGHIVIGKDKAKTATRRIVPILPNLAAWLAPYAELSGPVWSRPSRELYGARLDTAAKTEVQADSEKGVKAQKPVPWKKNALRHSYASYRMAAIADAGRVSAELGNSPTVIHRHYRELVTASDAAKWFAVAPEAPANVLPLAKADAGD